MSATFKTSDGVTLSYDLRPATPDASSSVPATKTPVLLVMGLAMPGRAWRFVVPHLDPDRDVVFYDHRGAGASDAPAHASVPYSMARLAADARELMDHLGWRQAHVVSISMGGMVAQHFALTYPERVRSLTLMATHAGGPTGRLPTPRGAWLFMRAFFAKGRARWIALAELLFPRAYREQVGEQWLVDVLSKDLTPGPKNAGRFGQLRAVAGHDTRRRLGELGHIRTLVVIAAQDLLVRPAATRELHRRIPGARLVVMPDAGHGLIRQVGEALGRELHAHFASA